MKLHEDWNDDFIELHESLISGLDAPINANCAHHASHLYYVYQLKINERYDMNNETAPFEVRQLHGANNTTTWEDYVIINNFIAKYNLSESAGDGVINLIHELCNRHGYHIPIPNSYKTIKRAIHRSMQDDYSYTEIRCEYHPDLITPGTVEPAVGVALCPPYRLRT